MKEQHIIVMHNKLLGRSVLALFIIFLGLARSAFFVPILLSACFIVFSFIAVFQDKSALIGGFLPLFFKDGLYTEKDIIAIYAKYAFGVSLFVTVAEMFFGKRFVISAKQRIIFLSVFFVLGYLAVFFLFIYLSGFDIQLGLILLFFLAITIFFVLVHSLIAWLMSALSKLLTL